MAKVIGGFKCPYTKRIYHVGDEYDGEHLEEMQKKGYVEKTAAVEAKPEWPKHIGGGVYELSNGDRVKGKEAAVAAQATIDAQTETEDQETGDIEEQQETDASDEEE